MVGAFDRFCQQSFALRIQGLALGDVHERDDGPTDLPAFRERRGVILHGETLAVPSPKDLIVHTDGPPGAHGIVNETTLLRVHGPVGMTMVDRLMDVTSQK